MNEENRSGIDDGPFMSSMRVIKTGPPRQRFYPGGNRVDWVLTTTTYPVGVFGGFYSTGTI